VALGCQETVQTLLERDILKTSEVASSNPDCEAKFSEAQGTAANDVTSVDNKTYGGKTGGADRGENLEVVEYQEGKWQEQGAPDDQLNTWADKRESECEDNDLARNLTYKGKGIDFDANQEEVAVEEIKSSAKEGAKVTLLSCELCSFDVKFSGGRNNAAGHLKAHMKSAHGVELPKFSCDKCSYSSAQAGHLRRHKNAKHEGIRYQCNLCETSFSSKDTLARHVGNKHKGSMFPCPQCKYETPRMSVLRDHIRIKHLNLKYECDTCGHRVNSKKNLKTHKNIVHKGIWLWCPEVGCDYKAKESSTLRHHKKVVHDGERLVCPHCPLCFTKVTSLKSHMKKKHSADMAN